MGEERYHLIFPLASDMLFYSAIINFVDIGVDNAEKYAKRHKGGLDYEEARSSLNYRVRNFVPI